MLEQIMNAPNFNYLERGLQAANLRQEVMAHNLANVNTPNFKRSEVVFEELLSRELYGVPESEKDGRLEMVRTHDKHLPFKEPEVKRAEAQVRKDNKTTMRTDNNNVDIDIEMAGLAKNSIYYNAMATQLGGYISRVRNVITSGSSG